MFKISLITADVSGDAVMDGSVVPLASRFNQAIAEGYVWAGHERQAILDAANDPKVASDPDRIYALQLRQEGYIKQLALSAALVSHGTKGIETLMKS